MLNEYDIAKGLLESYRSTRHFSPFYLKDDNEDEQVIEDSHIRYFTEHIKEAFHMETSEHWEIVVDVLDILSEKDRVKVIDMISQNHDGVELSKIERLTRNNKVVNTLIEAGIVEQNGVSILTGSNFDKVIICLETLRMLASLIEKEGELKRRRKVTIDMNQFNLANIDLSWSNLSGMDLSRRNLFSADLRGANLSRTNLTRANLANADLRGAYLIESNLTRANLFNANLRDTNLFGAYLTGANLFNADFTGANRNRINQI